MNNMEAENHGIYKARKGVINTKHGMITTKVEQFNIQT